MKIPGWSQSKQEEPEPPERPEPPEPPEHPQQPLQHERLDTVFGSRRGLGGIGCAVVILIWLVGSTIGWDTAKRNYTIRAQVSQGMSVAYRARSAVEEYLSIHGALPANNAEAGLPPPNEINDDYVNQVRVENGELVIVYGYKADEKIVGKRLMLVPDTSISPELNWTCKSPDIPDKWLTSNCRTPR